MHSMRIVGATIQGEFETVNPEMTAGCEIDTTSLPFPNVIITGENDAND
jgi:hypothetical protein